MADYLVLDGPVGTELLARGYEADAQLWTARAALDAPALLKAVHRDYLAAGADIITTNTFRVSSYAAAKAGMPPAEARKLAHASVALATEVIEEFASATPKFLAGSLGPLEDCYQPSRVPALATLEQVHFETATWLVETGCELILAETMGSAREAVVAVRAARKAGVGSVAVSFITDESGQRLLGGDSLLATARLCVESGAETLLVNCVHSDVVERALSVLCELTHDGIVIGASANSSRMRVEITGAVSWEADPRPVAERACEYAERALGWSKSFHARILGSCCGTSPEYIREVAAKLRSRGLLRK